MSKFIKQPHDKFIRASSFQTFDPEVGPDIYTPYGFINQEDASNDWQANIFLRQPKIFVVSMFAANIEAVDGHNAAITLARAAQTLKKNTFIINGGASLLDSTASNLDGSGSVLTYTGDPLFRFDTPANVLLVPNFTSVDPNAVIPGSTGQFRGFDILSTIFFLGDPYDATAVRDIAQERADQYLSNLPFYDRIRYRYYFGGVDSGIVTFYTALFGELPDVTVSESFLTDVNDTPTVTDELLSYITTESDLFFAETL